MRRPPHLAEQLVVDHGEVDGVAWVTCVSPFPPSMNGYVELPAGHPWRGLDYDDIHRMDPSLDVHGGLTYSDGEWVGFDTAHAFDRWEQADLPEWRLTMLDGAPHITLEGSLWTRERVAAEAVRLAEQVAWVARQRQEARPPHGDAVGGQYEADGYLSAE